MYGSITVTWMDGCIYNMLPPTQIVYTVIMKIITKIYPLKTNFVVVSSFLYLRTAKLYVHCTIYTENNPSFATTQCIVSQNAFQTVRLYRLSTSAFHMFSISICIFFGVWCDRFYIYIQSLSVYVRWLENSDGNITKYHIKTETV